MKKILLIILIGQHEGNYTSNFSFVNNLQTSTLPFQNIQSVSNPTQVSVFLDSANGLTPIKSTAQQLTVGEPCIPNAAQNNSDVAGVLGSASIAQVQAAILTGRPILNRYPVPILILLHGLSPFLISDIPMTITSAPLSGGNYFFI